VLVSRPETSLSVLAVSPSEPPLVKLEDSFYAKKGENRELRLYFEDSSGSGGSEYLRFTVSSGALLALPDGSPIAAGDSVLITVRVLDPARMLFEMAPSGLRFDPRQPAQLRVRYRAADADLNRDGMVNTLDTDIEASLAIWRQETPGDLFVRLATVIAKDIGEVEADVDGFSRYAVAY
jgi:hypothetical protein